jgi:REP element-mobilizing transposase RayT
MPTPRINNEYENLTHFLTITVIEWIDIFTKLEYFDLIIDSMLFCQKNKGLELYEYVIMPNHLHIIARANNGYKLSQIISDFKKHTTLEIIKKIKMDNRHYIWNLIQNSFEIKNGYTNQVWMRENYAEPILSDKFLQQKIKYIHDNPVKRGFVSKPEDWLYSSARNRILSDSSVIKLSELND